MHHATLPGSLPVEKCSDDAGVNRDGRRVIAHPRKALCGCTIRSSHKVHQAAARPIGKLIKPFALSFGSFFAVGGKGRVDHRWIQWA